MKDEYSNALRSGTIVGKYRIEGVLGSGGFGITYLATDTQLEREVALKECLPRDMAHRQGPTNISPISHSAKGDFKWALERFMDEARTLAKIDHPNVVRVHDILEANGTAYMGTGYEHGQNLESWLDELVRSPTEEEIRTILNPLLDGLEAVHVAGVFHRDLSPDNIFITKKGVPVLLDFGSARQIVSSRSRVLTAVLKPGYAPFEQYHEDGNQGPWTDIYSLCAVLHRMIVGSPPPEATRRERNDPYEPVAKNFGGSYSSSLTRTIDNGLNTNETERPQSLGDFRKMILTESKPSQTHSSARDPRLNPEVPRRSASEIHQSRATYRMASWLRKLMLRPRFYLSIAAVLFAISLFLPAYDSQGGLKGYGCFKIVNIYASFPILMGLNFLTQGETEAEITPNADTSGEDSEISETNSSDTYVFSILYYAGFAYANAFFFVIALSGLIDLKYHHLINLVITVLIATFLYGLFGFIAEGKGVADEYALHFIICVGAAYLVYWLLKKKTPEKGIKILSLTMALLVFSWLIVSFKDVMIGYFVWLSAYVMLSVSCWRREVAYFVENRIGLGTS